MPLVLVRPAIIFAESTINVDMAENSSAATEPLSSSAKHTLFKSHVA